MAIQTYGTQTRANPRLAVLRGWDINNPSNIAPRAEVATQGTILSGHLISKNSSGKWIKGVSSSQPATIAFAIQDDVDFDVIGSGVLTGVSVLGKYELQTPFFRSTDTYVPGSPLTYNGASGEVRLASVGTGAEASDQPIIGFVTAGVVNVAPTNSNVDFTIVSDVATANVLQFVTNYQVNVTDATGPA